MSSGEVSIRFSKQLTPKLESLTKSGRKEKEEDQTIDDAQRSAGNCTTTNIIVNRIGQEVDSSSSSSKVMVAVTMSDISKAMENKSLASANLKL